MRLSPVAAALAAMHMPLLASASQIPPVNGVALNGLLALEDWFFSWEEGLPMDFAGYPFIEVSSPPTLPQGRRFPSDKVPQQLIDPWLSEGGLCGTTSARNGDNVTVKAMMAHRESYITEYDFQLLQANGIQSVRLPVGWWAFAELPLPESAALIPDPCYPEKKFVSVPGPMLETLLALGSKYNVSFLVDMHAMPCGSSDGTYNGVFPAEPLFFANSSARALGLDVIRNMLGWFEALPPALQETIYGFTLLNEPGLGLVKGGGPPPRAGERPCRAAPTPSHSAPPRPCVLVLLRRMALSNCGVFVVSPPHAVNTHALLDNSLILQWLAEAAGLYKTELVAKREAAKKPVPLLYMNLHEAAFPGKDPHGQMGAAMKVRFLVGEPVVSCSS